MIGIEIRDITREKVDETGESWLPPGAVCWRAELTTDQGGAWYELIFSNHALSYPELSMAYTNSLLRGVCRKYNKANR